MKRIDPSALQILCAHSWPGNVRELQNAIERAVLLARDEVITIDALPPSVGQMSTGDRVLRRPYTLPLAAALAAFERSYLEHTVFEARGNIAEAARNAGVDRSNFRRLIKRHRLDATELTEPRESGRRLSSSEAPRREGGSDDAKARPRGRAVADGIKKRGPRSPPGGPIDPRGQRDPRELTSDEKAEHEPPILLSR